MNKRLLWLFLAATLAFLLVFLLFADAGKSLARGYAMGTIVEIRGRHAERALEEIKRLEKLFDKKRVGSDVWLINSLAGLARVEVSADTLRVVKQSIEASKLTNGAFDITEKNYRDIVVDEKAKTIFLKQKEERIDLGGIAKGYAVEAAREKLRQLGDKAALVNMISSIAVIGSPEGHSAWKIGIKDPKAPDELAGTVELKDGQALSTSGDYERGTHIIDPKTGRAVSSKIASVTIVTRDAGLADALTTAFFVMGKEKGIKMLKKIPVDAYFIVLKDGTILK